jgi:hypothetical protein
VGATEQYMNLKIRRLIKKMRCLVTTRRHGFGFICNSRYLVPASDVRIVFVSGDYKH